MDEGSNGGEDRRTSPAVEELEKLAQEVKERATELARHVADRVESFFGKGKEESLAETVPAREQEQARPPTAEAALEQALEQVDDKLSALDRRLAAQQSIDDKLSNLDKRMDEQAKALEEKEIGQKPEIEISLDRSKGHGIGW